MSPPLSTAGLVGRFAALVAPVSLIGGWTVAAAVQTVPYSSAYDTISELAQVGQPYRWVMTTAIAVTGVCYLVIAATVRQAHPVGRVVLAVGGVGTLAVAVFALPSGHHEAAATTSFVALALWPALSGVPGRGVGIAATVVLLVLLVAFGLGLDGGLVGLSERLLAGAESLWPLVALVSSRRARRERPRHS